MLLEVLAGKPDMVGNRLAVFALLGSAFGTLKSVFGIVLRHGWSDVFA